MSARLISIKSIDKTILLHYDRRTVEKSILVKNLIQDIGEDSAHNGAIEIPISRRVLKKIFAWCYYYRNDPTQPQDDEWDQAFLRINRGIILELFQAVNYLEIPPLIDLLGQFIAHTIQTMSPERMRDVFRDESGKATLNISSLAPELRSVVYGCFATYPTVVNAIIQGMNDTRIALEYKEWCAAHLLAFYSPFYSQIFQFFPIERIIMMKNKIWYDKLDDKLDDESDQETSDKSSDMDGWQPSGVRVDSFPVPECKIVNEYYLDRDTKQRFYAVARRDNMPFHTGEWSLLHPLWPIHIFVPTTWKHAHEVSTFFAPMKVSLLSGTEDGTKHYVLLGCSSLQEIFHALDQVINQQTEGNAITHLETALHFIGRFSDWQNNAGVQASLPHRFEILIKSEDRQKIAECKARILDNIDHIKERDNEIQVITARESRVRGREKRRKV